MLPSNNVVDWLLCCIKVVQSVHNSAIIGYCVAGEAFRDCPDGACDTIAFETCIMAYDAPGYTLKPEANSNK